MELDSHLIEQAHLILGSSQKIVVTNHVNPDGDAMGSALALAGILKKKEYSVHVIVPNQYPDFLKWMDGNKDVIIYDEHQKEADRIIQAADVIFHLDYNALNRSGPMQEVLGTCKAGRIMIDHHRQPQDFADIMYSDPRMSSTCEMVYHFIDKMGWLNALSTDEANSIYTGLITDTGNFRFSSTSPETHRVAGELLKAGVKSHEITAQVYDTNTPDRLRLLSRALEKMEVLEGLYTAIISLNKVDLEKFNYRRGDTEGFVNYGLSVLGVKLSVFFSEKDGQVKISFRSKGSFDVNQLARTHFNGGGHVNAAGGSFEEGLEEAIVKLKAILPSYKKELEYA